MLNPTYTRVYFPEEAAANATDPVLRGVPAERRATLIAELIDDDALPTYRFDIRYQGADETVFFDV
jgi:protocatechuate 3,4-dioxygenase alpha subunit